MVVVGATVVVVGAAVVVVGATVVVVVGAAVLDGVTAAFGAPVVAFAAAQPDAMTTMMARTARSVRGAVTPRYYLRDGCRLNERI